MVLRYILRHVSWWINTAETHSGSKTLLGLQRCYKRVFLYKNATCIYFIKNVNSLFVLLETGRLEEVLITDMNLAGILGKSFIWFFFVLLLVDLYDILRNLYYSTVIKRDKSRETEHGPYHINGLLQLVMRHT